jgi:hypothetical protein
MFLTEADSVRQSVSLAQERRILLHLGQSQLAAGATTQLELSAMQIEMTETPMEECSTKKSSAKLGVFSIALSDSIFDKPIGPTLFTDRRGSNPLCW